MTPLAARIFLFARRPTRALYYSTLINQTKLAVEYFSRNALPARRVKEFACDKNWLRTIKRKTEGQY